MSWRPWSDLTPTERRERADQAGFATFEHYPATPGAYALLKDLMDQYVLPAKMADRKTRLGEKSRLKLDQALGAIVGDVLAFASNGYAMKLSARKEAFTDRTIGRTAFWDIVSPLVTAGLIEHVDGFRSLTGPARAPLFMATPRLVELVKVHGLVDGFGVNHFPKADAAKSPVEGS